PLIVELADRLLAEPRAVLAEHRRSHRQIHDPRLDPAGGVQAVDIAVPADIGAPSHALIPDLLAFVGDLPLGELPLRRGPIAGGRRFPAGCRRRPPVLRFPRRSTEIGRASWRDR